MDHINNINNINRDRINSLISLVQDSKTSIREHASHILRLTMNSSYINCFIYDGPLMEISDTCTYADLVEYLISQRRAEPIRHRKKAIYVRLIAEVEKRLKHINADIKLQLL